MQSQTPQRKLVLASSSPYRKLLLNRLGLDFETRSPDIDESPLENESVENLVSRLAGEKARAVARDFPSAAIIGSDQLAVCEGRIVGKPGNAAIAIRQLQGFSGRTVHFLTAFTLICQQTGFCHERTVGTSACFRQLSMEEIRRYVELDQPLNCAGSIKCESAGITLLRSLTSEDPTAIIGLPLISLAGALRKAGFQLP
jgi:septum formation protein